MPGEIKEKLEAWNIRVELDERNEKINYKIREAQLKQVPYMFVIGDKEMETGKIALRSREDGDLGTKDFEEVKQMLVEKIKTKS